MKDLYNIKFFIMYDNQHLDDIIFFILFFSL